MAKDDVVVTTTLMAPRHGTTGGKFCRINVVQEYHRNDSLRNSTRIFGVQRKVPFTSLFQPCKSRRGLHQPWCLAAWVETEAARVVC